MEQTRQKALVMKDRLVQDFQEIRNNFPANFLDNFPKPRHVRQPNGCYKIIHESTTSSWRTDQQGKKWMKDLDIFLDYLSNNITGPDKTFEEIIDEISIALKGVSKDGEPGNINKITCSKEAFTVCLIRDCLKDEKLPIIFATNWAEFSKSYIKYLMSA